MKFVIKKYLERLKKQQNIIPAEEKARYKQKLRSYLILEDIKLLAEIEDIDSISEDILYDFSDDEISIIKNIAEEYDLSTQDAMAVIYTEAVLIEKKAKKENEDPDAEVVDIYDLVLNQAYLKADEDKDFIVVSLFEQTEEKEALIS